MTLMTMISTATPSVTPSTEIEVMTETKVLLGRRYRSASSSSNGNRDMGAKLNARTGGVKASWGRIGARESPSIRSLLLPGMGQTGAVKSLVRLIVFVLWSGSAVFPAKAAFSSLYVFGDGVCSTSAAGGTTYYQHTYSNGEIWIQVLAQMPGLTYDPSKNPSDDVA